MSAVAAAGQLDQPSGETTQRLADPASQRLVMPKNGEDEEEMQTFFQSYLTSILRPLAERVMELEQRADRLTDNLCRTDSTVQAHGVKLESHSEHLQKHAAHLDRAQLGLDDAHSEIARSSARHDALRVDHDDTKATLSKANDDIQSTIALVTALDMGLKASDSNIRQLQQGLFEADRQNGRLRAGLDELRQLADGLDERQMTLARDAQEARAMRENLSQEHAKLNQCFEKHKRDSENSHCRSDERHRGLEGLLDQSNNVIGVQGSQLRRAESDIKRILDLLDLVQRDLCLFGGRMDETDAAAKSKTEPLVKRLKTMEDKIGASMRGLTVQDGLVNRVEALSKAVSVNLGHISRHTTELHQMEAAQNSHVEHLSAVEAHVGNLGSRQTQLAGQMVIAEADIKDLKAAQTDSANKIEAHHERLQAHHERLTAAEGGLRAAHTGLQNLTDDHSKTKENTARIDSGLELAHRYLQGMSKGVQDTHRRVVSGQDGMLPPKMSSPPQGAKTLPTVPGAKPRTPSASGGYAATAPM